MENVQNCDSYINIPSPQTYRSYFNQSVLIQMIAVSDLIFYIIA
jgi:hypothetical protein